MPLHDSFKRKDGKPNIIKLSDLPTAADLQHGVSQVQSSRTPMAFTWVTGAENRALFIVRSVGEEGVNWTLRRGQEYDSPVIWRYATTDAHMIHTLLSEENKEVVPAVIPEELRPSPPEQTSEKDRTQSGAASLTDQEMSSARASHAQSNLDPHKEIAGTVFADKYDVISKVGRGGMGTVYKAKQRPLDRTVALKILHPHLLADPVSKRRFMHEAKATSALNHPNLLLIYDFGLNEIGTPFIVMDFLEGPTLQDILKETDSLDLDSFKFIFDQCCKAIAHAHERGIVHRDLKPSNIVLAEGENDSIVVKVVDFGLAKLLSKTEMSESMQELTQSGNVVGSPFFMSPEQCRGDDLDTRSDIYSLGCVMFTALTGVLPFVGKDVFQTLYKHIYEMAPRFSTVRPDLDLPAELERIIFKACERDRDLRYQTIDALWSALSTFFKQANVISRTSPSFVAADLPGQATEIDLSAGPDKAEVAQPAMVEQLSTSQLLLEAGVISAPELEGALSVKQQLGGDTAAIMVANGIIEHDLFDAATKCKKALLNGKMTHAQAVVLLGFCKRASVDLGQAILALGWEINLQ